MSCGVGRRPSWDPTLLWLWCRAAATALIQPLVWELPYAPSGALKRQKTKKKQKKTKQNLRRFPCSTMESMVSLQWQGLGFDPQPSTGGYRFGIASTVDLSRNSSLNRSLAQELHTPWVSQKKYQVIEPINTLKNKHLIRIITYAHTYFFSHRKKLKEIEYSILGGIRKNQKT